MKSALQSYFKATKDGAGKSAYEMCLGYYRNLSPSKEADLWLLLSFILASESSIVPFYKKWNRKSISAVLSCLESIYQRDEMIKVKNPDYFSPKHSFRLMRSGNQHNLLSYISSTPDNWKTEVFRGVMINSDENPYINFVENSKHLLSDESIDQEERNLYAALSGDIDALKSMSSDSFYDQLWCILFSSFCMYRQGKETNVDKEIKSIQKAALTPLDRLIVQMLTVDFSNTETIQLDIPKEFSLLEVHLSRIVFDRNVSMTQLIQSNLAVSLSDAALYYTKWLPSEEICDILSDAASRLDSVLPDLIDLSKIPRLSYHIADKILGSAHLTDRRIKLSVEWIKIGKSQDQDSFEIHRKALYAMSKLRQLSNATDIYDSIDMSLFSSEESTIWRAIFGALASKNDEKILLQNVTEAYRAVIEWRDTSSEQKTIVSYLLPEIVDLYSPLVKSYELK